MLLHHKEMPTNRQLRRSHGLTSPNPMLITICPDEEAYCVLVAMPGKVIVLVPLISKKISTRTVLNQMGPSIKRVPQYYMVVAGGCRNQTPPLSTPVALQF